MNMHKKTIAIALLSSGLTATGMLAAAPSPKLKVATPKAAQITKELTQGMIVLKPRAVNPADEKYEPAKAIKPVAASTKRKLEAARKAELKRNIVRATKNKDVYNPDTTQFLEPFKIYQGSKSKAQFWTSGSGIYAHPWTVHPYWNTSAIRVDAATDHDGAGYYVTLKPLDLTHDFLISCNVYVPDGGNLYAFAQVGSNKNKKRDFFSVTRKKGKKNKGSKSKWRSLKYFYEPTTTKWFQLRMHAPGGMTFSKESCSVSEYKRP